MALQALVTFAFRLGCRLAPRSFATTAIHSSTVSLGTRAAPCSTDAVCSSTSSSTWHVLTKTIHLHLGKIILLHLLHLAEDLHLLHLV
jgi:hypothetical protein